MMRYAITAALLASSTLMAGEAEDLYRDYYRYKKPQNEASRVTKSAPAKPQSAPAKLNPYLELSAGYFSSAEMDGFFVTDGIDGVEIDGSGSWLGLAKIGISAEWERLTLEAAIGGGGFFNDALDAAAAVAELGGYYPIEATAWRVGAHLSYLYLDAPDVGSDKHLTLDSDGAVVPGLVVIYGGETYRFKFSLDYISGLELSAAGRDGYVPSREVLELDGFGAQAAFQYRF